MSETPRATYSPEAWAMAEWAIPLHTHPIGAETWDVANCAGNWKPPTPDQVRSYIAQAVFRFQKETVSPLQAALSAAEQTERELRRLIDKGRESTATELGLSAQVDQYRDAATKLLERAELAEQRAEAMGRDAVMWRGFQALINATDKTFSINRSQLADLITQMNPMVDKAIASGAGEEK